MHQCLGALPLREAIATKFDNLYNTTYNPEDEIVVTVVQHKPFIRLFQHLFTADDEVFFLNLPMIVMNLQLQLNGGNQFHSIELPRL